MNTTRPLHDCWNRIGVRGDQTCERLAQYVHCRNCPVFTDAARLLMQRRVPAGYGQEWAERFAAPNAAEQIGEHSAMLFRLGLEWLALPTACLLQITAQAPVHHLPHRSTVVLSGIVNAGGKLTAQVSLAALLTIDLERVPVDRGHRVYPRLMVLALGPHNVAVPVQELHGIVRYGAAAVETPPVTLNRGVTRYLEGVATIGSMQVGLLDAGLLARTVAEALR